MLSCTNDTLRALFSDADLALIGHALTALTIATFGMFTAFCTYQLNRWRKYDIK